MLTGQKAIAAVVSVLLMVGLALFIKRSVWGKQIQAVAQNRLGASLAGIDATRTTSLIFVISGLLAALSGALLAPLVNPSPDVGAFPAIKSYVIVVLGGMGSIWGAMLAALILGVSEAFFSVYISYDYRDAFGLIILVLVLLLPAAGPVRREGSAGMKPVATSGSNGCASTCASRWSIIAAIALVPLVVSAPYALGIILVSVYFAILALAWNLLAGFTGQFSLAPAAFAMIGGYATALLDFYWKVPLALGIPAAIVGHRAVRAGPGQAGARISAGRTCRSRRWRSRRSPGW